jgi:phosphatidylserine synthase
MSGGILVSFIWVSEGYLAGRLQVSAPMFAVFVAVLGYLMISSIPFRNFRDLRNNRRALRLLALSLATCLTSALVFDLSMLWGVGALLYLFGGLADGLVVAWYHRRLGHALLVTEDEEDTEAWPAGR